MTTPSSPHQPAPPPDSRTPHSSSDAIIMADFRRRRARQRLIVIPLLLGLVLVVGVRLAREFGYDDVGGVPVMDYFYAGLAMAALVLPLALWNWRCPRCGGNLGSELSPPVCRHCHVRLHDEPYVPRSRRKLASLMALLQEGERLLWAFMGFMGGLMFGMVGVVFLADGLGLSGPDWSGPTLALAVLAGIVAGGALARYIFRRR